MTTIDRRHDEWHCQRCGAEIDAPDITGLLCSEHWLAQQEAA
jgi:hypothetical protein